MFRLPFLFIATGLVLFGLFNLATILQASGWILQPPSSPSGWLYVHWLILGWATMIAMGAVYQLISVVLQRDVFSRRLGYIQFGVYTAGSLGLLAGFAFFRVQWIALFAVLALIGILLFVLNIGVTIVQAARWNAITLSSASALLYLLLTGLVGLLMGLNFAFGLWPAWHDRLFFTHIWMGTVGWFGLLITGFSYKMLPMFYLAHGLSDRVPRIVLFLWNAAVLAGIAFFLAGDPAAGITVSLGLLALAFFAYNVYVTQVRQARHKKNPGNGVLASVYSTRALAVVTVATFIFMGILPEQAADERTLVTIAWAYLWGWVALTILGYLAKIVPFLWWTHKYGPRAGKGRTPTMGEMLDERRVAYGLAAVAAAMVAVMVGLGMDAAVWLRWSLAALSLFSLYYTYLIARVFTR